LLIHGASVDWLKLQRRLASASLLGRLGRVLQLGIEEGNVLVDLRGTTVGLRSQPVAKWDGESV
jgi:hypothetical protein